MNSLRKQFPREYRIWKAMRARCNAPCFKDSVYQRRKIKVCNRWDSFDSFMQDMGKCPPKYSIDRIDTYGDYCPENCRWASQEEQCKNRGKFNLIYTYQGETLCLKDWAKKFDIKYITLHMRLKRFPNLSFEELINYEDPRTKKFLWQGEYCSRKELCDKYGIPIANFYDRQHKGWSLEKILTIPVNQKI